MPTLVYSPALASYRFRPSHPINPRRLELTVDLIRHLGLAGGDGFPIVEPRVATDAEIALAHSPAYIAAVRELSAVGADPARGAPWGLGTEDTPLVPGMHDIAAHVVGATLTAARIVMEGRDTRAFTPAGGLHHAHVARASGFCVYNDLAVAIRWMRRHHGARVMYIDYDAHHGDGVQAIFYDDPEVLTVSLHESGVYLFPATGFVEEIGEGDGTGYSVNVPFEAHTEDESFLAAFETLVPELAEAFRPDVIVLQNGCDAHVLDPLAHLRATTGLFEQLVQITCEVADDHCGGRIVATGGGGYAAHTVVPRAWTLVWAALSGQEVPDAVPEDWRAMVRDTDRVEVPPWMRDPPDAYPPFARRQEVSATNEKTVRAVRARVMPLITGWGLAF
ncbi:MAG TPA: acetoin utilization protein AcuC [Longimicrobiales bacterium]|nr:acetoin utilization protein AcuC [Longimicrobiales bacterium]